MLPNGKTPLSEKKKLNFVAKFKQQVQDQNPCEKILLEQVPLHFQVEEKKVTCLGIFEAGWSELITYHEKLGHTVYHVNQNLSNQGIYEQILFGTSHHESIYLQYVDKDKMLNNMANKIFITTEHSKKIDILLFGFDIIKKLLNITAPPYLKIYEIIENLLQSNPKDNLTECLFKLTKELFPNINYTSLIKKQNLIIKQISKEFYFSNAATVVMYSKCMIATTLQANIERSLKGEPLIPIEMVFMMNDERNNKKFKGNFQRAKDKSGGLSYSNHELRLIYRLIHEIPDEDIKKIMQETFFLKKLVIDKYGNKSFIPIQNPWDINDEERLKWKMRTKSKNKAPGEETVPLWIKMLIEFKQNPKKWPITTKNAISNRDEDIYKGHKTNLTTSHVKTNSRR